MSTSTQTFAASLSTDSLLKNAHIGQLTIEHIQQFALDKTKKALDEKQQEEIKKLLIGNKLLQNLSFLLEKFIDIRINFQPLKGLNNQKIIALREMIAERKKFREILHTDAFDHQAYEKFSQNEKNILPLDQTVQWWLLNTEALRKEKVWRAIADLIIQEGKRKNETQHLTQEKLDTITNLQQEWHSHQAFAGFSSENLWEFYNTYVRSMEIRLLEVDKLRRKFPVILGEYINHLLTELNQIKREIIFSMLCRLQCTEQYQDIYHDDLLASIMDRIDKIDGINIQKLGKKPEPRRSLTNEIIINFVKTIAQYCVNNPHEKELNTRFLKLKMRQGSHSEEQTDNPLTLYALNILPELIQQMMNPDLIAMILSTDCIKQDTFIINKIRIILQNMQTQNINAKASAAVSIPLPYAQETTKKLAVLLDDIHIRLGLESQKKLEALIEIILSNNKDDDERISQAIEQTKRVNAFAKEYLQQDYHPATDIILIIANKLRYLITHNIPITQQQCDRLAKMIITFHPIIKFEQIKELKENLRTLPTKISQLKNGSGDLLLHFLVSYIEKPYLSKQTLATPMARHKHIAQLNNEKWDDQFEKIEVQNSQQKDVNAMANFISNVTLRLVETYCAMSLDNFDSTESCQLCTELKNAMQKNNLLNEDQKHLLNRMRSSFEDAVKNKITDIFVLKNHLFNDVEKKIDLKKLQKLIEKINSFFMLEKNKIEALNQIKQACLSLLKINFIDMIEHEGTPDMEYLQNINDCLQKNTLEELCRDNEIRDLLKKYIRTFDGTKSNLARLLTTLTPINNLCDCEQHIVAYAQKRLDYLKSSRKITIEDYYFFQHYNSMPMIAAEFKEYQTSLGDPLKAIIANKQKWHKSNARMIELFGDAKQIATYRAKRLCELIKLTKSNKTSDEIAEKKLQDFIKTVNYPRNQTRPLLEQAMLIQDDVTSQQLLDETINKSEWSQLLDQIVRHFGTKAQLHHLRTRFLLQKIERQTDLSNHFLGKKLQKFASSSPEINTLDSSVNQSIAKLTYLEMLGETNIQLICKTLEPMLTKIMEFSSKLDHQEIPRANFEKLKQLITCVKIFSGLYRAYGQNKSIKNMFINLIEIEKKLYLHYELSTIINQHTYLINLAKNDLTLHNLIMDLIKSIKIIENKELLTEKNIDHYLTVCEAQVLAKIEEAIYNKKHHFDYSTLATLANLFFSLSSDKIKILLLESHKNRVLDYPHWLTLINHLDESKVVLDLTNTLTNRSEEFAQTLLFARRLTRIKHRTNHLIKLHLLQEAKITPPADEDFKFNDFVQSSTINNAQLLNLWTACADKMKKEFLHASMAPGYINFIAKLLASVASELLKRSMNNPELLTKLQQQSQALSDIKKYLQQLFAQNDQLSKRYTHLWSAESTADRIMHALLTMQEQGQLLQLLQTIEKYAARKINKHATVSFRAACNDTKFMTADQKSNLHEVKQAFKIKNDKDAKKVFNAMYIFHKLTSLNQNKPANQSVSDLMIRLLDNLTQECILLKSKSYDGFLRELRTLAKPQHTPSNDAVFSKKARV